MRLPAGLVMAARITPVWTRPTSQNPAIAAAQNSGSVRLTANDRRFLSVRRRDSASSSRARPQYRRGPLPLARWLATGSGSVRERMEARLAALDTKEDNLLDLATDGEIPKEKIKERLIAIRDERASVRRDIERLDAELETGRQVFPLERSPHKLPGRHIPRRGLRPSHPHARRRVTPSHCPS